MNQYDAIFVRKSVKSFRADTISDGSISQILHFTHYVTNVFGKKSVNFEIWSDKDKDRVSDYHLSVRAPYYLVLSTDSLEDRFVNLGFVLEQVALYLVTKGFGSCFTGLHKEKRTANEKGKESREISRIFAFLAFGIPVDECGNAKRQRVLPLENVCVFKEVTEQNISQMIQAAILAPSRLNSQPWRFVVVKNRIHVFCRKERLTFKSSSSEWYHEFDIGMMLANLLVAGEEFWYNTEIVKSENIAEKELKNNIYMFTVIVTEQQSAFDSVKTNEQS